MMQTAEQIDDNLEDRASALSEATGLTIGARRLVEGTVILTLTTRAFGTARQIDANRLGTGDAEAASIRAQKVLVKSKNFDKLISLRGEASRIATKHALRTDVFDRGTYVVPVGLILRLETELADLSNRWDAAVAAFSEEYPQLVADAELRLGEFFNESDYPVASAVAGEFSFGRAYRVTNIPATLQAISIDLFREQAEQSRQQWLSAEADVKLALREGFAQLCSGFVDRLTPDPDGKKKRFHESFLTNFEDFITTFKARNILGDNELDALVDKARQVVVGLDAANVRQDLGLRDRIKTSFKQIGSQAAELVGKKTRKINLD